MRLGVVGFVPPDPRQLQLQHLEQAGALELTSACFHLPGDVAFELTATDLRRTTERYRAAGLELAQMGVGYGECLFDPDASVRARIIDKIGRGLEVAGELEAGLVLIRTGSLSGTGSYSPSPRNHEAGRLETLIEALGEVARRAEAAAKTVVIETHNLTIMGTPQINRQVIEAVGSQRLRVVMDYVNHFQSLQQAFDSTPRLEHIFEVMGPIAGIAHVKDLVASDGLVLHLDEAIPGEGLLDMQTALRRWQQLYADGYMLVEHLPDERIGRAVQAVRRLAADAGVEIH